MKKSKLLITLLIVIMGIVIMSFTASAETEGYYTYDVINGEAIIIGVDNMISGDVVIPDYIDGYCVTSIGNWAFAWCYNITSITFPSSLKAIEEYAFYCCTNLKNITIPNSLINIEASAFEYCYSLASITIPDGVKNIGKTVFKGCADLERATIGSGVISLAEDAFIGCYGLKEINVDDNNLYYTSKDGILFNKEETTLIHYPSKRIGATYIIPDSVTNIGERSFNNCEHLISVVLTEQVKTIGNYAFDNCINLENVEISSGVTNIGEGAFNLCYGLKQIEVDNNNVYYMDKDGILFDKEVTTLILYPSKKTETTYEIPDSVLVIGDGAFYSCYNLVSIVIPVNVISIGDYAFASCLELKDIYFSGSEEEWNGVSIGECNDSLFSATIHFAEKTAENEDEDKTEELSYYKYIDILIELIVIIISLIKAIDNFQ